MPILVSMSTPATPTVPVHQRVELHPGMDAWMAGDRYGVVVKTTRTRVHVKMDRSGRILRVPADRLAWVS